MQYVLSEEEFANLTPVKEVDKLGQAIASAAVLILKLDGFTCIHERPDSSLRHPGEVPRTHYRGYCDDCPLHAKTVGHVVNMLCSLPKSWSK